MNQDIVMKLDAAQVSLEQAIAKGQVGSALSSMIGDWIISMKEELEHIKRGNASDSELEGLAVDLRKLDYIISGILSGQTKAYSELRSIVEKMLHHLHKGTKCDVTIIPNPIVANVGFANHHELIADELGFLLHVGDNPNFLSPPLDALVAHEVAHTIPEIDAKCGSRSSLVKVHEGEVLCDIAGLTFSGKFFLKAISAYVENIDVELRRKFTKKHPSWAARVYLLSNFGQWVLPKDIYEDANTLINPMVDDIRCLEPIEQQFLQAIMENSEAIVTLIAAYKPTKQVLQQTSLKGLSDELEVV